MSTRVRFNKDYEGHKKGDVVTLRSSEAKQLIKQKLVTVQTDIAPAQYETKATVNHQSKDSSDGNPKKLRTNKSRRR